MGIAEPEVDFPRGGVPSTGPKTASKSKTTSKRKNEDALFGDGTKKSKTVQTGIKKSTEEKKNADKTTAWTKPMTLDLLTEGVCGVGVVREINDDHLIMETSDSCRVRLPANQIGKQFTDYLKKEQLSLDEVFRVGQMIPFRVTKRMEKTINKGKKKKSTTLPVVTCDPSKLNSHLVPSQLVSGLVIHSIVETMEEKGYVLDIGLQSAKGFLPLDKAPTEKLLSGQPLVVRIESSTSRVVKVSAFVEQDTLSADACEKLKLNHLMPGTIIECDPVVEDPHAAGVFVTIGNDIRAFVARRHLPPRLRADTSRLVKSFRSVVMFCQQNSNLLVLSAHPDIVAISKPEKRQSFEGLEVGDKLVCSVLDVIPTKFNVTFALPAGADGKASLVTASCSKAYLHKAEECETYYKIGSEHECRVVDFRYAERSVIVATRKDILKQKMISYRDAIPGELVKAIVTKPNAAGVNALIFGTIRGFMPLHLISDKAVSIEKTYPIDKEFQCRILNVDTERKQVTLCAKPALLKHSGAKINAYSEVFVGKTAVGIITKVFPTGALLVVFYNNVLGVLPAQEAKKLGSKAVKDKSVHVKVTSVDEEANKIQLIVAAEEETAGADEEPAKVEEKKKETEKTKKMAVEKKETKEEMEEEEDKKSPSKRSIKNFNIYTGTLSGQWDPKEAGSFCFKVKLPGDHLGRLHVSELPSKYLTGSDICGQFLKKNLDKKVNVKVIGFTTLQNDGAEKVRVCELTMSEAKLVQTRVREKLLGYRQKYKKGEIVTCFVSSSAKDPMHVRVDLSPIAGGVIPREQLTADMLKNSEEGDNRTCSMIQAKVNAVTKKKGRLQLNLTPVEVEEKEIKNEGFEMGQLLTARVLNVNQVNFGVSIQLASGQQAILGPTGVSENYERVGQHLKKFKKGELFRFVALRRDEEPRRYHVITEGRYRQYRKDPESKEATALLTSLEAVIARKGESVQGFLCYNSGPDYSLVEIGPGIRGSVKKNSVVQNLPLNSVLSVKIKDIDESKKKVYLSFDKVLFNTPESVEKEPEEPVCLKRKIELSTRILQSAEQGEKIEMEDPGFEWDNAGFTPDDLAAVGKIESATAGAKSAEEPPKKKVKKTAIEKERELAAREIALAEDQIETDEDFARLVRNEPNSAAVWIRYMSHFLEKDDLEKARATAERALTVIGYREETELFNLWTAYLNMEVAFGDPEATKTIFERACGNADSLKVHKQMAAIFIANEKIEEADEIFTVMVRKFRASSDDVWYLYADHLMATERAQEGRELLQRALASVPKIRHSQLISRFAQLEYQKGDAERGRTLFESLVTAYPKKTDLWMVYADFSLKYNGIEIARQVLERACSLSLNMHKLRPIYKKWMEFEEKHGDEKSQNLVRAQAQRALQSQEDIE